MGLWNLGVAVIFAREFLEAGIIIGQFRTLINKSEWDDDRKRNSHKILWASAGAAFMVALIMIIATGIGLNVASAEFPKWLAELIEGVSKLVAAFSLAILSFKIPEWLGVYEAEHEMEELDNTLTPAQLRFNVGWNIWREMAEIGAFLFPFFLNPNFDPASIPLSALAGIAIALVLGAMLYFGNQRLNNKGPLAASMATIIGWLGVGLFTGGMHEMEEAVYYSGIGDMTPKVFYLPMSMDHKNFPFVVAKIFGYSRTPTVLMICSFWIFGALVVGWHFKLWYFSKKARETSASSVEMKKAHDSAA
mmetsp:Transcript_2362/g.6142  ORF Transcript_2362/g.6142 Transcript_2362/m.6142 type:complete len:305 (-) Transcript_2362:31-945(-)